MFGLYANSRAPIATLSGTAYVLSITENIGVADTSATSSSFTYSFTENTGLGDSSSQATSYLVSKSEGVYLTDTPTVVANFPKSIAESVSLADSYTASAQFSVSITENSNEAATYDVSAGFAVQLTESLLIQDVISYFKYPVDADWEPIDTDIYTYSASELMFGAASFAQITFSGYVGGQSIVPPNWEVGSECAFETVPVYTYIPINPEGAIFGSGTFAGFTFGGFSGTYEVITTYETVGPVNTDVVWSPINTDIYTITGVSVAAVGALPFSGAAISSSSGGTAIVTPNWNDIVNS